MRNVNYEEIYETDVTLPYLDAIKLTKKETKKDFVRKKGDKPFSRFFLVLNGVTTFTFVGERCEKKKITAKKGDVVYLPPDIEYTSTWENIDEIDHLSADFTLSDSTGETLILHNEIIIIARDKNGLLKDGFFELYDAWCSDHVGRKLLCRSIFYRILLNVMLDKRRHEYRKKHADIYQGILYIENHFSSDISVSELSKMCGMCETVFRQKFKQQIGKTPIEYKNYLRIKKAAELLKNEAYTVTEAADAVNITDLPYFNKMFKAQYGLAPSKYKKESL